MGKKWIIAAPSANAASAAQRWHLPIIVAQLLLNRGIEAQAAPDAFLSPQLKDLHPPELLPGNTEAANLIVQSVREKKRILLYGDYDVDGTTGVSILWHMLKAVGADVDFYVPHRVEEGYGLNAEAIKRLVRDGAQLIVTIDCGVTAIEVARVAIEAGATLIITDHHARQAALPEAAAIVHPGLGDTYPNPHLCGAGVAFKLAWAIAQKWCGGDRVEPSFRKLLVELLGLAALGTIADVVPLSGENRIIAKHGLLGLPGTRLPGLMALIDRVGLRGEAISDYDVGFKLAPRINAAGRMGHARLAVELLTRADADRAGEIALYLDDHNKSRQATQRKILKQAIEIIDAGNLASDARRGIVVASEGWHAGVIGIVASKLVERYGRPTVVVAMSGGEGQGSGRSVQHFNLSDALARCGEHLLAHGGHAMAAGVRVKADALPAFTEAFVNVANNRLTGDDLVPRLRLDAEVSLPEMTMPTTEAILGLGPFGAGNPKPKFATGWIDLAAEPRCVGSGGDHLQASFRQDGASLKGIGFGLGSYIENLKEHRRCRIAFEPMINEFRNRRTVEMRMIDLQFPSGR